MRKDTVQQRKGYSLVELLFVLLSLTLLSVVIFQVTVSGTRAYNKGIAQMSLKQKMRESMERIATDVRQGVPATAAEQGFITPAYSDTATDKYATLEFYRYKASPNDNALPTSNTKITYRLVDSPATVNLNGVNYRSGYLVREEFNPTTDTKQVIAREICVRNNDTNELKSYFTWKLDPLTSKPDLSCIEIHLQMYHPIPDHNNKYEVVELVTAASLRTDRNLTADSTYEPLADKEFTTNLQRFGEPSSLVRPRE